MSAQHTPGPWKAVCRSVAYEGGEWPESEFLQWEVEGPRVPSGRGEFFRADARLIAAAPDLLAALESAADSLQQLADLNRCPANMKGLRLARAAIDKATAGAMRIEAVRDAQWEKQQ